MHRKTYLFLLAALVALALPTAASANSHIATKRAAHREAREFATDTVVAKSMIASRYQGADVYFAKGIVEPAWDCDRMGRRAVVCDATIEGALELDKTDAYPFTKVVFSHVELLYRLTRNGSRLDVLG